MQHLSEFPGPSLDDYANVRALNSAFISATSDLKGPQRGRLAAAPFLLFSLRENDLEWWTQALREQQQRDLMDTEHESPDLREVQTAAMSFLWQLAHRNPYATRIVSGASISWCEKIMALPLVTLLNKIAGRNDLIISRLDSSAPTGERLLGRGTSSKPRVRRSSQLTVLQSLLTRENFHSYKQLPAAACSLSGPLRVMDK